MKKTLLVLLSLFVSSYACAESPQLQYIKGMFELAEYLERSDLDCCTPDPYLKYFDNNLQNIYARNNEYGEITGDTTGGTTGCIDKVFRRNGNELNPKELTLAKLTFTELSKDKVKVTIGATEGFKERSVTYQVKCEKNGDCKITEIFVYGKPFAKEMTKCLDEFYRTKIKKN